MRTVVRILLVGLFVLAALVLASVIVYALGLPPWLGTLAVLALGWYVWRQTRDKRGYRNDGLDISRVDSQRRR